MFCLDVLKTDTILAFSMENKKSKSLRQCGIFITFDCRCYYNAFDIRLTSTLSKFLMYLFRIALWGLATLRRRPSRCLTQSVICFGKRVDTPLQGWHLSTLDPVEESVDHCLPPVHRELSKDSKQRSLCQGSLDQLSSRAYYQLSPLRLHLGLRDHQCFTTISVAPILLLWVGARTLYLRFNLMESPLVKWIAFYKEWLFV